MNPDGPSSEAEQPKSLATTRGRRWWLVSGLIVALALAASIGRPAFSRWQHDKLIRNATESLAAGDARGAYLSAREAILKKADSTQACAILAQIAEQQLSPEAILWRQRLVEIDPTQSSRLLELAATAVGLQETFIAEEALAQVPAAERGSVAFHATAAAVAIAKKQFARAEMEFKGAAALEPGNENLQLNLATIQLALPEAAVADNAVTTLERLREKAEFRKPALRALLADARRRGEPGRARKLARELRDCEGASLGDLLLWLEELQQARDPDFESELRTLQKASAQGSGPAYTLLRWMNARGLAAQSAEWCESIPGRIRAQMPVPLAEAEALVALADWKRLRELVRDKDWEALDFLRLAIHARVLLESDGQKRRRAEFRAAWERATNATRGNPNSLMMLGRLVNGWGWDDEAAQAWWLAAKNSAGGRVALKALFEKFSSAKNTRELYRVARRVLELEPANPVAKNNVASLALLLGEDEAEAHRIAEEIHRLSPGQPAIATTYALSLHRRKRTAEAVAALRKLPPQAFSEPSAAACFGSLLAENGERDAARPLLELAEQQKQQLFPEEAAMVAEALRRIR